MKISIDKEKCIKCGLCASACPAVFTLKEDGIEITQQSKNSGDNKIDQTLNDDLGMVKASCPVKAITISEETEK